MFIFDNASCVVTSKWPQTYVNLFFVWLLQRQLW